VDSDSWVQTRSDSSVDSDSWVRTRSDSSVDSDSGTRARSDSGLDSDSWLGRAWGLAAAPPPRAPPPLCPESPGPHAAFFSSVVASSCLDIFNGAALLLARKDHRLLRNEGPSQCPYFLVRAGDEESAKLRCLLLRARHSIYSTGHDFLLGA
jgi:hypothetical protein